MAGAIRKKLIRGTLRAFAALVSHATTPLSVQRAVLSGGAALTMRLPRGAVLTNTVLAGCPARRIDTPATDENRTLLYLHGGAYISGGLKSHTGLAAQLGSHAKARTWLLDYRLAPEHPHPAAVEDALAAYRELLANGANPRSFFIAGDSAGGGLTLATALAIRDAGLPQPAALALLSPWTDLTLSGASMQTRAALDPMLNAVWLDWSADQYCATTVRTHPGVSPLFADLAGLPPMIVHVGSDEILLDDATCLAQRAAAAGVDIELRVFDDLWHVFQAQAGMIAEADASLAEIGAFFAARLRR